MSTNQKCPRCGLRISRTDFRFCLRCGQDLNRGAIHVDCCDRWVMDPWAAEHGLAVVCPFCGKPTGMRPRVVVEAARAKSAQKRDQELEAVRRVQNPPKLPGVRVKLRRVRSADIPQAVARDLVVELGDARNRCVVITDPGQASSFFEAFKVDSKRAIHTEGQLITDVPTLSKSLVINDRFEREQPVFVSDRIAPTLKLQHSNRFFVRTANLSESLLRTLSRLTGPDNKSENPKVFEYASLSDGYQDRLERYAREEATIEGER